MKTRYQPLCQLQIQHSYYSNNNDTRDFQVHPTPPCQRILNHHNILFRQTKNGISLFVAVIPETDPAELFQQLNTDTLKLSFWLEVKNPLFFTISALPAEHQFGKELFYFDNLTDHRPNQANTAPLFLHDSTAKNLGTKLQLVTNSLYTVRFKPTITEVMLTLKDHFGNTLHNINISEPDGLTTYRINLSDIPGLVAGRYTLSDDQGNTRHFYFDPELTGRSVFGLVELYNTTKNLTLDNTEKIPASYQFLSDANTLVQLSAYTIKMDHRETIWRYIITKKYQSTGVDINQLSVKYLNDNNLSFGKTLGNDHITFTANKALPLQETHQPIVLKQAGKADMTLPNPTPSTALQKPPGLTNFSSDMYIYV